MSAKNKKILFIVQLPPPVHGVSLMNHYAINNPHWMGIYRVKVLPLNFVKSLNDIGRVSVGKLFKFIGFLFKLIYALVAFKPDMVYFTIMPTGKIFYRDALCVFVIKLFGPNLIVHYHCKGINEEAEKSFVKMWVYKKVFRKTHIICLSESLQKDVNKVYKGQPFILPNGIASFEKTEKFENKVPVILYLSNLVKSKGIEVLLESLVELNKKNINFEAKIVGNSADLSIEEVKEFCREKQLDHKVHILGPKYGDDKRSVLYHSDIFILPSFNECFPLSILEAMQAELAIISTKVGGIPDMIQNNINGMLINPNDSKDLEQKIMTMISNKDLRRSLGCHAYNDFQNKYTLDQFHFGLATIFNKVLETKSDLKN